MNVWKEHRPLRYIEIVHSSYAYRFYILVEFFILLQFCSCWLGFTNTFCNKNVTRPPGVCSPKFSKTCLVVRYNQARNQLGTPGGAKSCLRGVQNILAMSNSFKRCPTRFSSGSEKCCSGGFPLRPAWLRAWHTTTSYNHISPSRKYQLVEALNTI